MKIVILDSYSVVANDLDWGALNSLAEVTAYDRTPSELVVERCREAEIVLTNKVILSENVICKLPSLRYIGVLATGYNVVDLQAAGKRGIVVTNIPAYSTESVVQMTWAHIFHHTGNEPLSGKILGIVGLGHIGMRVAEIGLAFGMKVIAHTSKSVLPAGITGIPLNELFSMSDIVTLHCPLTDSNKEMVNAKSLKTMKSGAILINTGRGGLINEQDVAKALKDGYLRGYGTDVLSKEPPLPDNPLLKVPNCSITPHIAWATVEARQRLIDICINNVQSFLSNCPVNVVNSQFLPSTR